MKGVSHVSDVHATDDAGPQGVPDAVSLLYRSQHRRLVGLAALLVDDRATAEDVVQDAFLGLCRNWRRLRDPAAATGYLNRAVVNGGRDRLRRGRTSSTSRLRMVPSPEGQASAEHDVLAHDEQDRLWQAVTELPLRQRQVLVLRYYLDQTEAEIADILQVSHGSVKRHASRGLEALARSWEAAS
jgi:RNA polymerase sigma-70 factor (sigma-E family)